MLKRLLFLALTSVMALADETPNHFYFASTSKIVSEISSAVYVPVYLRTFRSDWSTEYTNTVSYRTSSMDAQSGLDYHSTNGTLTFKTRTAGTTHDYLKIQLKDDDIFEPDKSIRVELFDPGDGNIISNGVVNIRIIDNDNRIHGLDPVFLDARFRGDIRDISINPNGEIIAACWSDFSIYRPDGSEALEREYHYLEPVQKLIPIFSWGNCVVPSRKNRMSVEVDRLHFEV